ncbi:hypothetical protein EV182_007239, partial [Spiromyces aspiralis]
AALSGTSSEVVTTASMPDSRDNGHKHFDRQDTAGIVPTVVPAKPAGSSGSVDGMPLLARFDAESRREDDPGDTSCASPKLDTIDPQA